MEGYIRCSLVAFGDFSKYEISSKSIVNLMEKLDEFDVIPSVLDGVRVDIIDNIPNQTVNKVLQLNSPSKNLKVVFSSESIVIEAEPIFDLDSNTVDINILDVINNAKKVFKVLFEAVDRKASRISFISTKLSEANIDDRYKDQFNQDETSFFYGKDVFEWNARSVIREDCSILDSKETINVVSNIFRASGRIGNNTQNVNLEFDGILHEIDVNTIPENVEERIGSEFIESFYENAISIEKKVRKG